MKKLMIIASVMMLALASQAAQFNWCFTANKNTASSLNLSGATVYMLLASDYDSSKQYSLSDIESAAKSQGTLKVGMSASTGNVTVNDSWVVADTSYDWYAIVVNGDQYFVSLSAKTSTAVADTAVPGNMTYGSNQEMATASNWKTLATVSVPEPTSGLLMLVGLGALALRRRRA